MESDSKNSGFLTIKELAALFGVTERAITAAMKEKGLPGRRIGNKWYFSLQAVHKWFEGGTWEEEKTEGIGALAWAGKDSEGD